MLTDFRKLMVARFLFTFAVQMQAVVIGWSMYALTHDPLSLGMIGLAEAIPALSFALLAGYIVDRSAPLRIYALVILVSLLSALVLLSAELPGALGPSAQVAALYLSSLLTGTARGFSQPAVYAAVPRIVPRDELPNVSAWMNSALQVARILGPAGGGIVFGWLGPQMAAVSISVILGLAIFSVLWIRTKILAPEAPAHRPPFREEFFAGVRFVFRHSILLPALMLDMISVLFGGVTAILPIYAAEILFVGPRGLGILRAAPAVGAVLASLALTRISFGKHAGPWLLISVAGFGICILVFGVSHTVGLSVAALALSGAFDSVSMVIRSTAVQLASPDEMRGKISSVNSIFIGSSNELGQFESGVAARLLGIVPSVIFGGVVCLLTVVVSAALSPALRRLDLGKL